MHAVKAVLWQVVKRHPVLVVLGVVVGFLFVLALLIVLFHEAVRLIGS